MLAGGEESTKNEQGTPCIFDWVALRQVERDAGRTLENLRPYALVVMSDAALESKIDDANLQLLRNLEQRNVVEAHYIRRELFTGGEYRELMTEIPDGVLAIGGGKGTYSACTTMIDLQKPVLPVDLQLGSIVEDGQGAVALHREMMADPLHFFPDTHSDVNSKIGLLSLNRGANDVEAVASTVAELLKKEFEATPRYQQRMGAKGRMTHVGRFLRELPLVAAAIKIVEFFRGLLPPMLL